MTQENKQVSEQKIYAKPRLVNYGDLSVLTTSNMTQGGPDGGDTGNMIYSQPPGDAIEQSFEQFDRSSSSDSSGRGGRSGGE